MPKNRIDDLRNHLFETLEALKDQDQPMELDRARAISEVARTIIESAKVEVELVKAVGGDGPGSSFFYPPEADRLLGQPEDRSLPVPLKRRAI